MSGKKPREGVCMKCRHRTMVFRFECVHAQPWKISSHYLWLCTHDWSDAKQLDEDGRDACEELPIRVDDDFDPFIPAPRTELERAQACGPVGKIRAFENGREVTA